MALESAAGQCVDSEDWLYVPKGKVAGYESLLRRCAREGSLSECKLVHEHLQKRGYDRHTFLANLIVQMYGKCGSIGDAASAFHGIQQKDLFSWNIMLAAYAENGQMQLARDTFDKMPKRDVVSWNALMVAHAHRGHLDEAERIFSNMPQRNTATWNALVAAYAQNGYIRSAFHFFWVMSLEGTRPNEITFISILEICWLSEGRNLHSTIASGGLDSCVKVANALISMYGECGSVVDAELLFGTMLERNVVTWTAMIGAYAQNGQMQDARKVFDETPQRNVVSWNAMIHAYAEAGDSHQAMQLFRLMEIELFKPNHGTFMSILVAGLELEDGKYVHSKVIAAGYESHVMVATALLSMYGMCGEVDSAREVFDGMTQRDAVCWNAMVAVSLQNGRARDALELFFRMDLEGVKPNEVTLCTALDVCAALSMQSIGRLIHSRSVESAFWSDTNVANALVNMYGKCGNVQVAQGLFSSMQNRDVASWNISIAVYGHNGLGDLALEHFLLMCLEGFDPDDVTFLVVLAACSHAGLFLQGLDCFVSIQEVWHMDPTAGQYMCLIDMLGRAGQLCDAEDLLNNMPYEPQEPAFRALLGGCRINTDIERGERAAESLLVLDSDDSSPYVLLSNMYASVGSWKNVAKMRSLMSSRKIKKQPGLSWIEIRGKLHTFAASDRLHPQIREINDKLKELRELIQEQGGYVPDLRASLHNVDEKTQLEMLWQHSEKLAIAFGLLSTPSGTPLFISKNIRVCLDCHAAVKFICKTTGRRIVMRDTHRFHHFNEAGECSCGDFW